MQAGTLTSKDVTAYRSQVLVNGVPREAVSWSVDRDLSGDLPEQVAGGAGITQATGEVTWAAVQDIAGGVVSPWWGASGWMPRRGDRVQIFAGDSETMWSQFVGIIDQTKGRVGGELSSTLVDDIDRFSTIVNIPALMLWMPPLTEGADPRRVGLSNIWYSVYCLRAAGFYTTPPPEYRCSLDVPAQAGMWPHKGTVLTCAGRTDPDGGPTSYKAPWGTVNGDFTATYRPSPRRGSEEPVQFTMLRGPEHTQDAYIRATYGTQTCELLVTTSNAVLRIDGSDVASCPLNGCTVVQAILSGSTGTIATNAGTTATGTGALTAGNTLDQVEITAFEGARVAGFQISHPAPGSTGLGLIGWTPNARIQQGNMHTGQTALPAQTNRSARDIIDEMTAAILRPMWIDETGVAQMIGSDVLHNQSPVATLTTLDDIFSLDWEDDILSVRSEVRGTYREPSVTRRSTPSVTVWEASESIVLQSGESQETLIEPGPDEDWVLVDETLTQIGGVDLTYVNKGRTSFTCGIVTDGDNEQYASPNLPGQDWMDVAVEKSGELSYRITHTAKTLPAGKQLEIRTLSTDSTAATSLWPMWWGKNMPILRAYAKVEWTSKDATAVSTGAPSGTPLEHDFGAWATSYNPEDRTQAIDEIMQFLAEQTSAPHPRIRDMSIAPDPRLQLGDVANVSSPNLLGVTLTCLITGTSTSADADGLTQTLTVRIISVHQDVQTYTEFQQATPTPLTYTQWETLNGATQTYAAFNEDGE